MPTPIGSIVDGLAHELRPRLQGEARRLGVSLPRLVMGLAIWFCQKPRKERLELLHAIFPADDDQELEDWVAVEMAETRIEQEW
jgi:hypothetical protein